MTQDCSEFIVQLFCSGVVEAASHSLVSFLVHMALAVIATCVKL